MTTAGSFYDTRLAVFRGPRLHRTLVACNDDYRDWSLSAVQTRFAAGSTYWIAVSSCCRVGARGGHLVLNVYPPEPAGATVTIDKVETGGISGELFLSGTVACATPSMVDLWIFVSQRVGTNVARGGNEWWFDFCPGDGTKVSWQMPVDSDTGWAFQAGSQAAVSSSAEVMDLFADVYVEPPTTYPTVVDNPAMRSTP